MGQAKDREATKSVTLPFHVTKREQLHLSIFLVGRKNTQSDLRKNEHVFEELGVEDLVDTLIDSSERSDGTTPGSVRPAAWASTDPISVGVTRGTVDHLIKMLDVDMEGAGGVILHRLLTRLKRREDDSYVSPFIASESPSQPE